MGIVEEDVGAKGLQKRPLVAPTKEQCLVQSHPPLAQGKDHALVRRCRASGDQRGVNRRVLGRKCPLNLVQGRQKAFERATRQRLLVHLALVACKRLNPLLLTDAPGLIAKYHRVARSEEHTYELQSLMRTLYSVLC